MKSLRLGDGRGLSRSSSRRRAARSPTATSCCNELGAVDDDNELTPIGRELARLPLDPRVGRMILEARDARRAGRGAGHRRGAVACRTCATGRWSAAGQADQAHKQVRRREERVHRATCKLWKWLGRGARGAAHGSRPQALATASTSSCCAQNFINIRRVREWRDIHSQLHTVVAEHKWRLNDAARQLRAAAPVDAGRPARQHRLQVRRRRVRTWARAASSSTAIPART